MRAMTRRSVLAITCIVVGLFLGSVSAVAIATSNDDEPAPPPRLHAPVPTEITEEIASSFGVLLGDDDGAQLSSAAAARMRNAGVSAELAQVIERPHGSVVVAPGRLDSVCLLDGDATAGGCTIISDAIERGAVLTDECARVNGLDGVALNGLVRDGIASVELVGAGSGEVMRVSVESNTWYAEFPVGERPRVVRYPDGNELAIAYSPDVQGGCEHHP